LKEDDIEMFPIIFENNDIFDEHNDEMFKTFLEKHFLDFNSRILIIEYFRNFPDIKDLADKNYTFIRENFLNIEKLKEFYNSLNKNYIKYLFAILFIITRVEDVTLRHRLYLKYIEIINKSDKS
jgi:hypothetical protein